MITFKTFLAELYKPNMNEVLKAINSMRSEFDKNQRGKSELTGLAKQYKFSKIGEGFYAIVYKHEQYPFVVKVWRPDEGFDTWLKFVIANQNNPYVPKVKGKPVRISGTNFKAIRLEYLHKSKMKDRDVEDVIVKLWQSNDKNMKNIVNYIKSTGRDDDLHSENIMQRANGEWVITDPLAW